VVSCGVSLCLFQLHVLLVDILAIVRDQSWFTFLLHVYISIGGRPRLKTNQSSGRGIACGTALAIDKWAAVMHERYLAFATYLCCYI
jgi:hypothetical protein